MTSIELLGKHILPKLAKCGASNGVAALTGAIREAEAAAG